MKVKVKKLNEHAQIPKYAHDTDAGLDLIATTASFDDYGNIVYGTGLAVEIPDGYMGLLFPRSSVSKYDLSLCNSIGLVDSGYRGEIMLKYTVLDKMLNKTESKNLYQIGEKVGQLVIVPYPKIELEEVDTLEESDRGEGGFGSTGK